VVVVEVLPGKDADAGLKESGLQPAGQ
jgi:hypothetical protein